MNTSRKLAAMLVAALLGSQALAQLPNQPVINPLPASGDYGAYSTRDASLLLSVQDPLLAKAYDNFTLTDDYIIDGLSWHGIFSEEIPDPASDVDFLVEIWNVDPSNGLPDTSNLLYTYYLDGGPANASGIDVTVTPLGYDSPPTSTTVGGGAAYSYDALLPASTIAAGDYWISITANQRFDHPTAFDPEWQWHLGSGPGDGFSAYDAQTQAAGSPVQGVLQADKDLAFTLKGQLVPEPASMAMALFGFLSLGLFRPKRS